MNRFLYYFDKWTAWLDFSWLLMTPKKQNIREYDDEPTSYEPTSYEPTYETEPFFLRLSYHK